jgi:hypothetical protein
VSVTSKVPELGTIAGSAPEEVIERIKRIPGVLHVSESQVFELPPSDSPIQ